MRPFTFIIAAIGLPAAALAQDATTPDTLTPDQKGYIVYDRCIMHVAIEASHTDARDEDIFALAKAACAATRTAVTAGQESNHAYLDALDAADADKAKNFPAWVKGVRERRRAFEAPNAAR